jgi:hypothetical protein
MQSTIDLRLLGFWYAQCKFNRIKADAHDNEPPKHSNSEERDNSTVEGDLHSVSPEPTAGITNRRQKTNTTQKSEEVRSEVFILCGVVDRVCGPVVRVPGYRSRAHGFDSPR